MTIIFTSKHNSPFTFFYKMFVSFVKTFFFCVFVKNIGELHLGSYMLQSILYNNRHYYQTSIGNQSHPLEPVVG